MKRSMVILMSVFCISGCGPEVLSWDEEVLLNTEEIIVVHREATYTLSGSGDNPLKLSMRPRRSDMSLSFKYHGKQYRYTGDASLLLLAISPQGIPNLVINPGGFSWDYGNNFNLCAEPYYGQLTPDATGAIWTFPENIDSWLHGLRRNINDEIPYEEAKNDGLITHNRISSRYKSEHPNTKMFNYIDPEFKNDRCGRELSIKTSPRDLGLVK